MASFGKVLDLLDDRYLELQDVTGNVEPLPTLVPYEDYTQNVHVYRMDTSHEIFMGLIQDFTMRRAHETGKELWTWCVQWEVDHSSHPSSPKKVRLDAQQPHTLSNTPQTPRQVPALTIFERRTLDGALMLEEEMLRILIDIVQVASALVPNFIEFLYRWVDYYEGDGKALKAALRWEIPSLWDFEYHPLVLPPEGDTETEVGAQPGGQQEERAQSASYSRAAELRESSPTKKMHARPKPNLAAIELRTFYTEESERLQYREVKYGIQPPKLEQPLPPLINIPRDQCKRAKYYAACFKSRQRALYLLLEAGVTMRQINNYQKLQTTHPKETPESGDGNGLRNYQKDAKYAQAQFELKEEQVKQREIAISNKLAAEAHFAAQTAVPDGASGLPLIPPTPSYAKRPDMAAAMVERIRETRVKKGEKINFVPKPLVGRMRSKMFEYASERPELMPGVDLSTIPGWYVRRTGAEEEDADLGAETDEFLNTSEEEDEEDEDEDDDTDMESDSSNQDGNGFAAMPVSAPNLPRPPLPLPLPPRPSTAMVSTAGTLSNSNLTTNGQVALNNLPTSALGPADQSTPSNIATYMQNLSSEQAERLLPLLSAEARRAVTSRLGPNYQSQGSVAQVAISGTTNSSADDRSEPDPAGHRCMYGRVAGSLHPRLPTTQPIQVLDGHSSGSSSFASAALGLPARPSPAASFPIETEQRRSQGFSFKNTPNDHSSRSDQPKSELGAEVAESAEEDMSRPLFHLRPVQNTANLAGLGREALVNVSTGRDLPNQYPSPVTLAPDVAQQRIFNMSTDGLQSFYRPFFNVTDQPTPSIIDEKQHAAAQENHNVPVYALAPTSAGPASINAQPTNTGFNAEYFMHLRRQQELSVSPTTSNTRQQPVQLAEPTVSDAPLTLRPQLMTASELGQPWSGQIQEMVTADLAAMNARTHTVQASPSLPLPPPLPSQPQFLQSVPLTLSTPPPPFPPPSGAMLPPPRAGMTRNAPSPLSLPPSQPSPFSTIVPQIPATSPFLDPPSSAAPPIQIYLPQILVAGNSIGPGGQHVGNDGRMETDALLLGHEDAAGGALVLSKALFLPVGVWENTLRKVRGGRWSVLETYGCPSTHPAKGKGKARAGVGGTGREAECHGAVYGKLATAYALMRGSPPAAREELLTKRWRVSRGPLTALDRGAVWEGWAAYIDQDIKMSAIERKGAMGRDVNGAAAKVEDGDVRDGYWPCSKDGEAARRRREMEELMDEDEDMDD
ncbi:hypothetical protein ST47_g8771 [Ascochyta rabiei]|uniref:Uncharacterized protein n=1 Tax=Didymella rabiei TaxID=5454 RepID=A0A162YLH4_DIDRA|nr:hypothetical protein ST47_g8771 [Ascochyta rabiei]